jgi:hypothetical protein
LLQIGDEFANTLGFLRGYKAGLSEFAFSFSPLARQQVAFKSLGSFDFPAAGDFKPLCRPSFSLDLRQLFLLDMVAFSDQIMG